MNLRRLLRCCEQTQAKKSLGDEKIKKQNRFVVELRKMLRTLQEDSGYANRADDRDCGLSLLSATWQGWCPSHG